MVVLMDASLGIVWTRLSIRDGSPAAGEPLLESPLPGSLGTAHRHRRILDGHAAQMPRTMLRYATKPLEKSERNNYRGL